MKANTSAIWRYLSFPKFISMLETKTLFFPPLRQFIDKYEGFIHGSFYHDTIIPMYPFVGGEEKAIWTMKKAVLSIMNECFVSCWYMSETEDQRMWELYVGECKGVALKTRTDRLSPDLNMAGIMEVKSGAVVYGDHVFDAPVRTQAPIYRENLGELSNDENLSNYAFNFAQIQRYEPPELIDYLGEYRFIFRKREKFQFEKEYRIVLVGNHGVDFEQWKNLIKSNGVEYGTCGALHNFYIETKEELSAEQRMEFPKGKMIPIDLGKTIEEIRIQPGAPSWIVELVERLLERYGLAELPVLRSALN